MAKFVELDEIKPRIETIISSSTFELNNTQKKAIELFLNDEPKE